VNDFTAAPGVAAGRRPDGRVVVKTSPGAQKSAKTLLI
jgi:hypothetical protein